PLNRLLADALGRSPAEKVVPSTWILVVGTASYQLPDNVFAAAERIGHWLATNGYGLIVGGSQGVDHVVARAFVGALSTDRSVADFLVRVLKRGVKPDFEGGRPEYVENDRQKF